MGSVTSVGGRLGARREDRETGRLSLPAVGQVLSLITRSALCDLLLDVGTGAVDRGIRWGWGFGVTHVPRHSERVERVAMCDYSLTVSPKAFEGRKEERITLRSCTRAIELASSAREHVCTVHMYIR
jgi:hypothetical protein